MFKFIVDNLLTRFRITGILEFGSLVLGNHPLMTLNLLIVTTVNPSYSKENH